MFRGITRQEQRTLILLIGIVISALVIVQFRGERRSQQLVIDAQSGEVLRSAQGLDSSSPRTSDSAPAGPATTQLVDLNIAGPTELMTLPGIGETRAREIIAYREQHGPFRSVDDLDNVSGIGEGILGRVRDHATVSGVAAVGAAQVPPETPSAPAIASAVAPQAFAPAPPPVASQMAAAPATAPIPGGAAAAAPAGSRVINVNTATAQELMELPGIGETIAGYIIQHRTTRGPFQRPEDLLEVNRIGERTLERLRPLIAF